MRLIRVLALLLAFACADAGSLVGTTGSAGSGSTDDFDVTIVQTNTAMVMRNDTRTDLRFDITIANRTPEPYTVKRIALQSMSGPRFTIPISTREFDRTIAPNAKEKFLYWATAQVTEIGTPREPITMRATVEAVSASGEMRSETFTARINARVQVQLEAANR